MLFSTHVMPQAEEICDHVVMIHRGHKVLDDPVELDPAAARFARADVRATRRERDVSAVRALPEVERCSAVDGGYEIALREGADVGRAMQAVIAAVPVARIELKRPRLEDVFVADDGGRPNRRECRPRSCRS